MEKEMKYKVKVGDIFGGFVTAGENLSLDEARKLRDKVDEDCDYFTTSHMVDENGKILYY